MRLIDLALDPVRGPLALALAVALMRVVYAIVSRVVAPFPRLRALVEAVAAASPDVLRAGLQVVAVITGKPAPKLDALPAAPPDAVRLAGRYATAAELQGALDAAERERDAMAKTAAEVMAHNSDLARRVADLSVRGDGTLRPTVVPGEGPAEHEGERRAPAVTTRHRIVGATLAALALCVAACGPIQDAAVAPFHGGSCLDAGASLCRGAVPYVCSHRGHLWPATPAGEPCPHGCTMDDGGARCVARRELDAGVSP